MEYWLTSKNEPLFRRVVAIAEVLDNGGCTVDMCDIDAEAFRLLVRALSDADCVFLARDAWVLLDMIDEKRFVKYWIDKKACDEKKILVDRMADVFQVILNLQLKMSLWK